MFAIFKYNECSISVTENTYLRCTDAELTAVGE